MAGTKGRSGGKRVSKPKELKVLEGTFRKDREPANVPEVEHCLPERPAYLSERAVEVWDDLVRWLGPEGRNVLTEADGLALGQYAQSCALYEESPTIGRESQLRGWAALFGLTPADRQRIPAISKPKDEIEYVKPRGAK